MKRTILYSILQYKHSLVLGEAVNIGVIFSFPEDNQIYFVAGNTKRVKSIYPHFDSGIFNIFSKSTNNTLLYRSINSHNNLFGNLLFLANTKESLKEYINTHILPEDSTSLQFTDIYTSINSFENNEIAIEQISKNFLPEIDNKKELSKHNEHYIQKRFLDRIIEKNINPDHRFIKNKVIDYKGVRLGFELAWKNGITHLVKPISFDLQEGNAIQNKSVTYFGYLDLLNEYAKINEYKFDLLLGKPQDDGLISYYENAVEILDRSTAPKEIILEENILTYSDSTAEILHKKDLE